MKEFTFKFYERTDRTEEGIERKRTKSFYAESKMDAFAKADEFAYENGYNDFEFIR